MLKNQNVVFSKWIYVEFIPIRPQLNSLLFKEITLLLGNIQEMKFSILE